MELESSASASDVRLRLRAGLVGKTITPWTACVGVERFLALRFSGNSNSARGRANSGARSPWPRRTTSDSPGVARRRDDVRPVSGLAQSGSAAVFGLHASGGTPSPANASSWSASRRVLHTELDGASNDLLAKLVPDWVSPSRPNASLVLEILGLQQHVVRTELDGVVNRSRATSGYRRTPRLGRRLARRAADLVFLRTATPTRQPVVGRLVKRRALASTSEVAVPSRTADRSFGLRSFVVQIDGPTRLHSREGGAAPRAWRRLRRRRSPPRS